MLLSHNISPFNLTEVAYIIKSVYDTSKGQFNWNITDLTLKMPIAMKFDDNYFIGADNGVFSNDYWRL